MATKLTSSSLNKRKLMVKRILISLLVVMIGVAAVWSAATLFSTKQEARRALREAKDISLAIKIQTIKADAEGTTILDSKRTSGFTKAAEDEIGELAEVSGDIYLVSTQIKSTGNYRFFYETEGVLVDFTRGSDETIAYKVYSHNKTILAND